MIEFDVKQSIKNQAEVVKKGSPDFAPFNGVCWRCGFNIYDRHGYIIENHKKKFVSDEKATNFCGITVEESKRLVTGCPHCNRSYCD